MMHCLVDRDIDSDYWIEAIKAKKVRAKCTGTHGRRELKMHEMTCPICGRPPARYWETNLQRSFSGIYVCPQDGRLRITGTIRNDQRTTVQFVPGCTMHGIDEMVPLNSKEWRCCHRQCGRAYELMGFESKKIVLTWGPGKVSLPPLTAMSFAAELAGGVN